jgi:CBS domain-containing protein
MITQAQTTAQDLMTTNPVSIRGGATVPEVLAFLTDTGFSAAPVIDNMGRPVGVVSRTDVVVYERARTASSAAGPDGFDSVLRAADLMTPIVFSVAPEAPAVEVAREMVQQNVHRLFVVRDGTLIGVISALDVLRHFSSGD